MFSLLMYFVRNDKNKDDQSILNENPFENVVWKMAAIHRPQKVYEHYHQRGIRGKLHIGRLMSREPNIVGC